MNSSIALFTILIIASLITEPVALGESRASYHIGNSLTWDCELDLMPQVFANEGFDYDQGWHIDCSMSLTRIVEFPGKELCSINPPNTPEPYGAWSHALASYDWDFITLEGYPAYATGNSEVAATLTLINDALSEGRNTNCVFFMYFAWPQTNDAPSYTESINRPYTNASEKPILCKDFADFWFSSVTQAFPNLDIRLIPTGHVLEALDQKLGEIPVGSLSNAYDLYRDNDHMDWTSGRYVAHATMLAAMLGKPPSLIAFPDDPGDFINQVDPELVELANEVIWSVLTQDERTKIIDPPSILIQTNNTGGLELSFIGTLQMSTNLNNWTVTNLISPHRLNTIGPENGFFQATQPVE